MTKQVNIIRRQTLHFNYKGSGDAFAIQQDVNNWCTTQLIPAIEQELDSIAYSDRYISIDTLEFDVTIDHPDWQQAIKQEILHDLRDTLVKHQYVGDENFGVAKRKTDLVLFFFEKGYLPWWASTLLTGSFSNFLQDWLNEEGSASANRRLKDGLTKIASTQVIHRVVYQVPPQLIFRFYRLVFNERAAQLEGIESFLGKVINETLTGNNTTTLLQGAHKYITRRLLQQEDPGKGLPIFLYSQMHAAGIVPALKGPQVQIKDRQNPWITQWHLLQQQKPGQSTEAKKLDFNQGNQNTPKMKSPEKQEEFSEGIFIQNAGVVIVAAFIPELFRRLEVMEQDAMVQPDLAVQLIQFAVTGKSAMPEHELLLPKILCGVDIEQAVDPSIIITETHKAEVERMLAAVITNWPQMEHTSVAGLRDSFLNRDGKLRLVNNEWMLQVDRKAYDMILDSLPWSISIIKLSWMSIPLRTEWN